MQQQQELDICMSCSGHGRMVAAGTGMCARPQPTRGICCCFSGPSRTVLLDLVLYVGQQQKVGSWRS